MTTKRGAFTYKHFEVQLDLTFTSSFISNLRDRHLKASLEGAVIERGDLVN